MNNGTYRPSSYSMLPMVVKNLIIINGLFYLATITLAQTKGIDLIEMLGLHYWGSDAFKPFQFLTYMFMHSTDISHVFFNMFALWMFGVSLENYWGPKKFLTYYLITGLGAAITHYAIFYFQFKPSLDMIDTVMANQSIEQFTAYFNSNTFIKGISSVEMQDSANMFSKMYNNALAMKENQDALRIASDYLITYKAQMLNQPVVVGASGAVFGILLAFGMTFPNQLIYLYFFIPLKAKYFVILYGVAELYFGVSNTMGFNSFGGSNVAHFAHLGGMIFGILLILFWKKRSHHNFY